MLLEDVIATTTTTDQTIFTVVDDTKTTEKQQITDTPGDGLDSLTTVTSILTATTVPETFFVRTTTDTTTDFADDSFGVGKTERTTIVTAAGEVDNVATTLEDIVTEEPTTRRPVIVTTTEEVDNTNAVTEEFFDDDPEFNEVDNEGGKNIVCLN